MTGWPTGRNQQRHAVTESALDRRYSRTDSRTLVVDTAYGSTSRIVHERSWYICMYGRRRCACGWSPGLPVRGCPLLILSRFGASARGCAALGVLRGGRREVMESIVGCGMRCRWPCAVRSSGLRSSHRLPHSFASQTDAHNARRLHKGRGAGAHVYLYLSGGSRAARIVYYVILPLSL